MRQNRRTLEIRTKVALGAIPAMIVGAAAVDYAREKLEAWGLVEARSGHDIGTLAVAAVAPPVGRHLAAVPDMAPQPPVLEDVSQLPEAA